jgi:hypothetical protein
MAKICTKVFTLPMNETLMVEQRVFMLPLA